LELEDDEDELDEELDDEDDRLLDDEELDDEELDDEKLDDEDKELELELLDEELDELAVVLDELLEELDDVGAPHPTVLVFRLEPPKSPLVNIVPPVSGYAGSGDGLTVYVFPELKRLSPGP